MERKKRSFNLDVCGLYLLPQCPGRELYWSASGGGKMNVILGCEIVLRALEVTPRLLHRLKSRVMLQASVQRSDSGR